MKKVLFPLFTAFTFLVFLSGIRFIDKDTDLYLTSKVIRVEPQKLKPGFRFIPPLIYRVSRSIPEEIKLSPQTARPKIINPGDLSAQELSSLVKSLYIAGEYTQLISALQNISEKELLKDENLLIMLAESFMESNLIQDAFFCLYRALSVNINNPRIYLMLSKAYHRIQNYQNAAEYIDQALFLNPGDRNILIQALIVYLSLKEYSRCDVYLSKLQTISRDDPAVSALALDYYLIHKANIKKSQDYINILEKIKPDNPFTGILLFHQGDFLKASELLQRPSNENKYEYYRLLFLSKAFFSMGMYKDATLHAKELIRLSPEINDTLFFIAGIYSQAGLINEAVNHILQIDKNRLTDYFPAVFDILLQAENYDICISLLNSMLEKEPYNFNLYNQLGSIYLRKRELNASIENYSKSLDLFPFQAETEKAIRDIENILSLEKKDHQ